MAELPKERLAYQSPPFTNTGVDYFGPFYVTVRRTIEKRRGFLFTFLTTRAVRVEVVPSMDTSSCVIGVERFACRPGTLAVIWSDNGTNFIGAEKELHDSVEKWNTLYISAELAHKVIKWRFNPPSAQHQGGIWERLVRSFKRVLNTILGTRRLTDEVLNTTFCLVEHELKSRPLAPVSADASDLGAARLKREIFRALTVTVDKVFMWTDSTILLQWINSINKQPIFIANRVSEILENTSVDQWNHVATCDKPADFGTRGKSAEVLQSSSWVRGPDFLRTKQFPFVPNTDVVDNIQLGVVTKEQDDDSISSLVASLS